jgi:hypothetical protein
MLIGSGPPGGTDQRQPATALDACIRSTPLAVTPDRFQPDHDLLRLELFDDASFELEVMRIETREPDSFTCDGRIRGDMNSRFVLVREAEAIVATIWTGDGRVFELRPSASGALLARQMDPGVFAARGCMTSPQQHVREGDVQAGPFDSAACVEPIDVLMVYTEQSRLAAGGTNAIRAIAQGSVAAANLAYDNSQIGARLRLAQSAEVSYFETGSFVTELLRLSVPGDGFLDEVQALRDESAADVVCLLVTSAEACGIAYVMETPSPGFEGLAYSVVNYGCAISSLTVAHEFGHNLGCQHNNGDGTTGAFPFSYGHIFTGASGQQWLTVMAAGTGIRTPQFSNPRVLYDGVPTGVAEGLPGQADNAQTINMTSPIVAAFRSAPALDCNRNQVSDTCDITSGASPDLNNNGIPDECDGPSCAQPLSTILTAESPHSFDSFGISIGMSADGGWLVAGAELDDGAGFNAGAAHVMHRMGDWTYNARLVADDTEPFDRFGRAVAIAGDGHAILIGALFHDSILPDAGSAYVFVREGAAWVQQARLAASDPDWSDLLGFSVAISAHGSRAAIGAPADDDGGTQSGSVYVFERDGITWTQTAKLTAADATIGSEFGSSVAMTPDGTRILVGARASLNTSAGAAYVFRIDGTRWIQEAKLVSEDAQGGDRFGGAVGIDAAGTCAVVGARGQDQYGENAGAAYVFQRQDGIWRQRSRLAAPDAASHKLFGVSVAISPPADWITIGSHLDQPRGPADAISGSAYVFKRNGPAWQSVGKLATIRDAAYDNAGLAVAIASTTDAGVLAAIAAPLDDHSGTVDGGSVRIFAIDSLEPDCNSNSLPDSCDIAQGLSLDADGDGVPDECDSINPCPTDIAPSGGGGGGAGNGAIDIDDLLMVINSWGPCAPGPVACAADVDGSGDVDVHDLLAVINAWGICR